jgi:hypothetical protein
MVIHYQPGRLRRNSDQPTAITGGLVATSPSSYRTGDIPLGTPTCSARTHHGRWALYPHGTEVVVVWPGGAVAGPPGEVAGELEHLGGDRHRDGLDRAAASAIRRFLTGPAVGYWLSGPANQPGHHAGTPAGWTTHPARPPRPPITLPDPQPEPTPARAA